MIRLNLTILAFLAVAASASAAPPDAAPVRTLTVTGTGIAKAAPDEASFSTGVVSRGATARQALAANAQAMTAVIATLKKQGVPDKAIHTSNLSLSPQYQQCKPNIPCPQRIVGYEVSNTVSVTIDLDKAGAALDALVASGSNQIDGISFAIHDTKPLLIQARAEAVKDALEKGQLYAWSAGVVLGPILSIQEAGAQAPQPMFRSMNKGISAGFAETPIAAGEQSVSAQVSVTWIIN